LSIESIDLYTVIRKKTILWWSCQILV
jgi:hypothetical protein